MEKISKKEQFLLSAIRTIDSERVAIERQKDRIGNAFSGACEMMLSCKGRIIVLGMGKSGHVGRKIAATFASTGSPSFFVHAAEANHGDMGMITGNDVVLAISYSGKTSEIISLIPLLKRIGTPIISMSGNAESPLALESDIWLDIDIEQEACPLNLAPTCSTTVTLVLGDALAIALLEAKGFSRTDFAFSHPSGTLGTHLLLRVEDIMHTGKDLPLVQKGVVLVDALLKMSSGRLGMIGICNEEGIMEGIFTDGDLRRAIDKGVDVYSVRIDEVMTAPFVHVKPAILATESLKIMQNHQINGLFCMNEKGYPVGAFNMLDLVNAGII